MEESKEIFSVALEFDNGTRSEWMAKADHFEAWFFDGEKRVPVTLNVVQNYPKEACGTKQGYFMKADSQQISWKRRYFIVSGGLMTYFKESNSTKPQGTIPLKDCSIDLPNDMRKSFSLKSRREVDGYEVRITHMSRRPFLVVFASEAERREWVSFLTSYIAHTFLSESFMLAEKVAAMDDGLYVTKLSSSSEGSDGGSPRGGEKKRYLYIDWFSADVKDWCLKYSAMKLAVVTDSSSGEQTLAQLPSASISMQSILSVEVDSFPSSDIIVELASGSVVEFSPVSGSRETALAWCKSANAAMKLQELSMPSNKSGRPNLLKRNSTKRMADLRSMLQSPEEPRGYTRDDFLRDQRSMNTKIDALAELMPTPPPVLPTPPPLPPSLRKPQTDEVPSPSPVSEQPPRSVPVASSRNSDIPAPPLPTAAPKDPDVVLRVVTERGHRASEPIPRPHTYSSDNDGRAPLGRGSSLRQLSSMTRMFSGVLGRSKSDLSDDGNDSAASDSGMRRSGSGVFKNRRLSTHRSYRHESGEVSAVGGADAAEGDKEIAQSFSEPEPTLPDFDGRMVITGKSGRKSPPESSGDDSSYYKRRPSSSRGVLLFPPSADAEGSPPPPATSPPREKGAEANSIGVSDVDQKTESAEEVEAAADDAADPPLSPLPDLPAGSVTIVVEHKAALFLLAADAEYLGVYSIGALLPSQNKDENVLRIPLPDCVSADIDLNSSGLMRLVLKSASSSDRGEYVQWMVRSRAGHNAALEWMKSLRHFKRQSEVVGML